MIVDDAGQIGARQLHDLLELIETRGAGVILSGDTRQHGPVEASDALSAIERYSGLLPRGIEDDPPTCGSSAREVSC